MARFYLLPSRHLVGRRFSEFLAAWFPGMAWQHESLIDGAETLANLAMSHANVYVVHEEDLDTTQHAAVTLMRDFGAEPGDEVVEVRPPRVTHWHVPDPKTRAA